jgi:hypothetical protein
MSIRAIHNHIIFKFIDKTNLKGMFEESKTASGIILQSSFDESAKQPRWARIVAAGPQCSDVIKQDNIEILIDNLKWTNGVKYNGEFVWRTDESQLLGYRIIGE